MAGQRKNIAIVIALMLTVCVTDGRPAKSDEKAADPDIERFQLVGIEQIPERNGEEILIHVPYETDLTDLQTEITPSGQAMVRPAGGDSTDFTTPRTYTVTAVDGRTKDFRVTVVKSRWRRVLENGKAPFLRVDGHQLAVFKDKMWLLGGWLGRFDHDQATYVVGGSYWTSQVWCTSDGIEWESKGNAPWAGRHGFGCVVHDNKLWVIGGDQHTDVWNTEDGEHWNKISDSIPCGERYFPYVVSYHGKILMMGGVRIVFPEGRMCDKYNDVWSTTDGVRWTRETEFVPWAPRGLTTGSAVLDDTLYLYGGCLLYSYAFNDVWKTKDGTQWTQVVAHAPWGGRQWCSIATFDKKLWIMAGDEDIKNDTMLNDVWYSADGAAWTQQQGVFWEPRHAAPVIEFKNKLWLVGGLISRNDGGVANDVWAMDPSP